MRMTEEMLDKLFRVLRSNKQMEYDWERDPFEALGVIQETIAVLQEVIRELAESR